MDNANAQPQKTWIRPPLGKARMDELFAQIKEGLDKYNQREAEKKKAGKNRFSGQFSHLRTTPTRPAAKAGTAAVASSPSSTSTKTSKQGGVTADRPYLFGSQLKTLTGPGCVYREPVKAPAPKPMTFAPPSFVFGGPSSAPKPMTFAPPSFVFGGPSSAPASKPEETPSAPQQELGQGKASTSAEAISGKRKASDLEGDSSSSSLGYNNSYCDSYDYGFYAYPAPMFGQKKWSKEEVAGLVALANKWIPDLKKRRVGEKKDESQG